MAITIYEKLTLALGLLYLSNAIPMQYIFDLFVDAAMCQFVDGLGNLPIDQLVSCSIPVYC